MRIGELFAGIGGLSLGLEWAGVGELVWVVERDPDCQEWLRRTWPNAELFPDVRRVGAHNLSPIDLLCGGFPCQDVSSAGRRVGLAGKRSGLWCEFARITDELKPRWVVVENVASGASRWVDAVVLDLVERGYAPLPCPVSATDLGAPHRRARIFVVAKRVPDADVADGVQLGSQARPEGFDAEARGRADALGSGGSVAARRCACPPWDWPPGPEDREGWARYLARGGPEPAVRRGSDGVSTRTRDATLRALGNAVVPQCSAAIGHLIRLMEAGE